MGCDLPLASKIKSSSDAKNQKRPAGRYLASVKAQFLLHQILQYIISTLELTALSTSHITFLYNVHYICLYGRLHLLKVLRKRSTQQ